MVLLPRAPYEAKYTPYCSIIGFSFDDQTGTHAFATDRKTPFHAMPNGLAYVPAGCDVYSRSSTGGEYLRVTCLGDRERPSMRFGNVVDTTAIQAAFTLRRALLSGDAVDLLDCEHSLMALESRVTTVLVPSDENDTTHSWMSESRLRRVVDFVEARLDTPLTVSEIAVELELSPAYFSREFKKSIGRSPHQYIVDRRLERARHLLQTSQQNLSSIAYSCGFSSHSHMTELFRKRLGTTPGRLREQ